MSLLIGWAEESLVPSKKVDLAGQFFERISEYVESEISVTAMAVESDGEQMIIASADVVSLPLGLINIAREKFSKICPGVDPRKLIVGATHTHTSMKLSASDGKTTIATAVSVLKEFLPEGKDYTKLVEADDTVLTIEEGNELVTDKIALAAKNAWENRKEALYTNEFGRAAVGMCR